MRTWPSAIMRHAVIGQTIAARRMANLNIRKVRASLYGFVRSERPRRRGRRAFQNPREAENVSQTARLHHPAMQLGHLVENREGGPIPLECGHVCRSDRSFCGVAPRFLMDKRSATNRTRFRLSGGFLAHHTSSILISVAPFFSMRSVTTNLVSGANNTSFSRAGSLCIAEHDLTSRPILDMISNCTSLLFDVAPASDVVLVKPRSVTIAPGT
jgi:hypothetical protein